MEVETTVVENKMRWDLKTCLWAVILSSFYVTGDVVGGTTRHETTENQTSLYVNATLAPFSCPAENKCNTAAAVIGSLIGGLILGAIVTHFAGSYLRKRKHQAPPKDYDVTESSHYDVNRNNDGILPGPPKVKGHKKLERLVKPSRTSSGDIEVATAAVPLIKDTGVPKNTEPPPPANTRTSVSTVADKDDTSISTMAGEDNTSVSTMTGKDNTYVSTVAGKENTSVTTVAGEDNMYANVGGASLLFQPYESLDIILEETEYDTPRAGNYERFLPESASK